MKAAYHNFVVAPESRTFCGIITQDGVWEYQRMAFGFSDAPAHFQAFMDDLLRGIPGGVSAEVYFDDIHPHGHSVTGVWGDTVRCIRAITSSGMMINLAKCVFLVASMTVLGYQLFQHEYQIGQKSLKKLLGVCIPRT